MLYPQDPRPQAPYAFRNIRPFVQGGPIWSPQARALTVFGLLSCDLSYRGRSWADVSLLWQFYDAIGGAAGRFTFVDFNGIKQVGVGGSDPGVLWTGLFVAQGDGTTAAWDAPTYSANVGSLTIEDTLWNTPLVYVNGVPVTTEFNTESPGAGHFGFKVGTGTDGVDKITVNADSIPTDGQIITVTAQCRRALRRARFLTDTNPFQLNAVTNYQTSQVTVQEVRK